MCPELSESLVNAAVSSKERQRASEDTQFTWRDFRVYFLSLYIYSFQLSSLKAILLFFFLSCPFYICYAINSKGGTKNRMKRVRRMTAFREMNVQLIRQLYRWHIGLEVHNFTAVGVVSCA
jgi:hypothetical protein